MQKARQGMISRLPAGLEALRRLRLQQLQGEAQLHSGLQAAGRGRVTSVADDQLLVNSISLYLDSQKACWIFQIYPGQLYVVIFKARQGSSDLCC